MKKTYKHPALNVARIETQILIAQSPAAPEVTINKSGSVDAESVEVKGSSSYNVWDDDWSK